MLSSGVWTAKAGQIVIPKGGQLLQLCLTGLRAAESWIWGRGQPPGFLTWPSCVISRLVSPGWSVPRWCNRRADVVTPPGTWYCQFQTGQAVGRSERAVLRSPRGRLYGRLEGRGTAGWGQEIDWVSRFMNGHWTGFVITIIHCLALAWSAGIHRALVNA